MRSKLFLSGTFFLVTFLLLLIVVVSTDAASQKRDPKEGKHQQQQHRRQQQQQQRHSIAEVAARSNPIPPAASSMANAFAAKPHGEKMIATSSSSSSTTTSDDGSSSSSAVGHPSAAAKSPQQQQQQRHHQEEQKAKSPVGLYLQPSAAFSASFSELGRGNMTAVKLLHDLAIKRADGHAMMLLGVLYGSGVGVPRSEARAKLYHTFAAQSGIAESIVVLAMQEEAQGNCDAAVEYAKQAADISARFNSDGTITPRWDASRLTQLELKQQTTTESEFDVQLLLAERGNGPACCAVGYAYMLGLNGVDQDGAAARLYFERGMDLGEAACFSGMGQLYARGVAGGAHPIARSPKDAARFYRLGAEKNHAPSLNGLGFLHAAGALSDDGARDFEGAAKYFEQSAALNNPPGTYNIGLLYLNGKGVRQDSQKALQKFQRAASMGSLLATYQLANMFAVGASPISRNCNIALGHYNQVQRLGPWNLRWNMARAALYASSSAEQHDHPKLHQQQQQQQQDHHDDAESKTGGGGLRLPASPGEALLHYLILGAMGRPKASQNAMFVIERFLDESHPLVSFNGTVGSRGWRDDALIHLAQDEALRRIKLGSDLSRDSNNNNQRKKSTAMQQQQQQQHDQDTEEHLRAIAHELATGSYRNVVLHRLVRDAARDGSADAKLDLALHFWDGVGTPRSQAKAREAYRAAAQEGSVEAMWTLGWLHSTTEEEQQQYFLDSAPSAAESDEGMMLERIKLRVAEMTEKFVVEQKKQQHQLPSSSSSDPPSSKGVSSSSSSSSSLDNKDGTKDGRRRRRIVGMPGSVLGEDGPMDSMSDSPSASMAAGGHGRRHKRDIHRAKHYYDQVAEMFPSSWFAVRIALLRLNFLWWYDHFFASSSSSSSSAAVSSAATSGGGVAQSPTRKSDAARHVEAADASSPTTTTTTTAEEGVEITKKRANAGGLSLRTVYKLTRRIGLDVLRTVDPMVGWGMTLSDILVMMSISVLVALLLIRHHAFGV